MNKNIDRENKTQYDHECLLCRVAHNDSDVPFTKLFDATQVESQVLLRGKNVLVIADVAPLVEGHCLIIPINHYASLAQCPPSTQDEIHTLIRRVSKVLFQVYNNGVIVFEHGQCVEKTNEGCGINHAHLHILPLPSSNLEIAREYYTFFKLDNLEDLTSYVGDQSYLLIQSPSTGTEVLLINEPPPQILRKLVSKKLPCKVDWNWHDQIILAKMAFTKDRVYKSINALKPHLKFLEWKPHTKLIRDNIPHFNNGTRRKCQNNNERVELLVYKLIEESEEYWDSRDPSELADVLEVLLALAEEHGLSKSDLEEICKEKRSRLGGFSEGWVLEK